jgi:5-methylcytosine-specific restriction endonuclease McrA
MVDFLVLVLNQNYEPLNVCQIRRAIVLIIRGKAEVIENGRGYLHSMDESFDIPSVIRLVYYIRRPYRQRKMTKLEIFNRDQYICQYCGRRTKELTLDHVIPKHRGGQHTWENVVSACVACNRKKAGRSPREAGMPLLREPGPPAFSTLHVPYVSAGLNDSWQKYLS